MAGQVSNRGGWERSTCAYVSMWRHLSIAIAIEILSSSAAKAEHYKSCLKRWDISTNGVVQENRLSPAHPHRFSAKTLLRMLVVSPLPLLASLHYHVRDGHSSHATYPKWLALVTSGSRPERLALVTSDLLSWATCFRPKRLALILVQSDLLLSQAEVLQARGMCVINR